MFQVGYNAFYHPQSSADKCILFSDRNLINRRNVSTEVKAKYSSCKQFFNISLEARIVAKTLQLLDIENVDDLPCEEHLPADNLKSADKQVKKMFLNKLATNVVEKFVLQEAKTNKILQDVRRKQESEDEQRNPITADGKYVSVSWLQQNLLL